MAPGPTAGDLMRIGELAEHVDVNPKTRTARDELEQLVGRGVPEDQPDACFCHLIETTSARRKQGPR